MRHRKPTHNQTRWQRRCKQRSRPSAPVRGIPEGNAPPATRTEAPLEVASSADIDAAGLVAIAAMLGRSVSLRRRGSR